MHLEIGKNQATRFDVRLDDVDALLHAACTYSEVQYAHPSHTGSVAGRPAE
jgi:hypothetical protein